MYNDIGEDPVRFPKVNPLGVLSTTAFTLVTTLLAVAGLLVFFVLQQASAMIDFNPGERVRLVIW